MNLEQMLPSSASGEYICLKDLDLYSSSKCSSLATQAASNRRLRILSNQVQQEAIEVCLCEDDYPSWLKVEETIYLKPSLEKYQLVNFSHHQIQALLPQVINFTHQSMEVANYYLWGGTVAPNYDCSGLIQAAFSSVGIWLPRDAYQQQQFAEPIPKDELQAGDLVFFSKTPNKITHVGLCLGEGRYIHSSGREIGRNGIGIDELSPDADEVSRAYYQQFHSGGRIVQSYQPTGKKWSRA
ncbi:C40 family peptidase [Merismopedia glauca]|uniref:Glycoside hydrolase n=1 Tax=Merismopedia glauca CCAP 1448/3 TaxID=1296344 RepID=A0A2T1C0Q5_9CYAN|nr:C40 family peptidase [Merismopedia glauca]PSB01784.1 glycoside hydrolase [Merismopedia glauca CCAP 1448/3]